MSNNVKFLSGGISSIDNVQIVPGQIIFALSDDKQYGYIAYDYSATDRVVMSTRAIEAGKVSHKLTIGEIEYDGSKDVSVPVYDGNHN